MNNSNDAIALFDSGMGGISVLKEALFHLPNENYIFFGDSAYSPYGTKTKDEVRTRCLNICDFLFKKNVKAIIIACNTATSAAVDILREKYPQIPIIGMEPALKVATQNHTNNHVIVMATALTLKEKKFINLMQKYAGKNDIIKMPCPELVHIVESDLLDDFTLVNNQLHEYFKDINFNNIDSIVLGCTHFIFFRQHIKNIVGNKIQVIDGNLGTINHLKSILIERNLLNTQNKKGTLEIFNSNPNPKYITLSDKLINWNFHL